MLATITHNRSMRPEISLQEHLHDYALALQDAIEAHCRGEQADEHGQASHYAKLLNSSEPTPPPVIVSPVDRLLPPAVYGRNDAGVSCGPQPIPESPSSIPAMSGVIHPIRRIRRRITAPKTTSLGAELVKVVIGGGVGLLLGKLIVEVMNGH